MGRLHSCAEGNIVAPEKNSRNDEDCFFRRGVRNGVSIEELWMSLNILVIKAQSTCEFLMDSLDQAFHEVCTFNIAHDFHDIHPLNHAVIIVRIDTEHQQKICDYTFALYKNKETRHIPLIAYIPNPDIIDQPILENSAFADIFSPVHKAEYPPFCHYLNSIARRYQELNSMAIGADILGIDMMNYQPDEKYRLQYLLNPDVLNRLENSTMPRNAQNQYACTVYSTVDEARAALEIHDFHLFIIDASLGTEALKFASMIANKETLPPVIIVLDAEDEKTMSKGMQIRSQGIIFQSSHAAIARLKIMTILRWTGLYRYCHRQLDRQLHLSQHDELTDLFNRRYMDKYTQKLLRRARRENQPFCLCIADIDHFKKINDQYGHLIGDEILASIAATMKNRVRLHDIVGRWGGEEFMIIFSNLKPGFGSILADRLRRSIEETAFSPSSKPKTFHLTISIGFSSSRPNDSSDNIIERADKALYAAKERGRNRVICYEELT